MMCTVHTQFIYHHPFTIETTMAPGVIQPNLVIIDQNTDLFCTSQQEIPFKNCIMKNENLHSDKKFNDFVEPTTLIHRSVRNDVSEPKTSETNEGVNIVNKPISSEFNDGAVFKPRIRWPDFIAISSVHFGAIYGLFLFFYVKYFTILWFFFLIMASGFGITAGAHRLWSHKAYKANWQLRLILVFLFSIAGQRDAYTWAHDHRVHHKYSETDADPHDARRGFFFAHVGWLFLTPHPEVVAKRKIIDLSDLQSDPIVMWQKKYYELLFLLITIGMPTLVPWYYWNESLWLSFWVNFVLRFCVVLNIAFFVNSVAHMYGKRPYDKTISPSENIGVAIAAMGEGWHNYHHVFPWDYKTGELGDYTFNVTTAFIDIFAKIGWASDRKSASPEMIARRVAKCGDGTHFLDCEESHKNPVWGLGDDDIPQEDLDDLEKMQS
ncbi:Acyl-CoA Delta-9 desaturase [Pseudolycoriella hygida]|uniref:Acyl-CoA Delta-9 desaturase n=1 Tax=Pseudolycoriella hygida TaxID=35572 RepID=A0A9Q0MUW7_9DIPT|nr:Acyl-CoA Delta-9 desaturase [Pseudolycoriella hygida]